MVLVVKTELPLQPKDVPQSDYGTLSSTLPARIKECTLDEANSHRLRTAAVRLSRASQEKAWQTAVRCLPT